jgi:hypothetical protein
VVEPMRSVACEYVVAIHPDDHSHPREGSRHNGGLTALCCGYRGSATPCVDRDAPPNCPRRTNEPTGGGDAGLLRSPAGGV